MKQASVLRKMYQCKRYFIDHDLPITLNEFKLSPNVQFKSSMLISTPYWTTV